MKKFLIKIFKWFVKKKRIFIMSFLFILINLLGLFISFELQKYWVFKLISGISIIIIIYDMGMNFDIYFPPRQIIKFKVSDLDGNIQEKKIILNRTTYYVKEEQIKGFKYQEVKDGTSSK